MTAARGRSPGPSFAFFALLSIAGMYFDQHGGWISTARHYLQAATEPVQILLNSPGYAYEWVGNLFETRESLRAEIAGLKSRVRELSLTQMRFEALEHENAQLRALQGAMPTLVTRRQVAEVVSADLNPLRQRLLVNKGKRDDVFE